MSKMRTLLAALAVSSAVAATPADSRGQGAMAGAARRDIDTTFFFSKIGTVVVGNGAATVIVTGWDQTSIRVKARNEYGTLRFDATSSRVTVI
jgi:hypothetical protein